MNDLFKKLTEEIKTQLNESFQTKEIQDLIVDTKAKSDTGEFKFIASTSAVDRQGESIDQAGWELENYLKNSVLLWAHDYSQPPIGVVDKIGLENGNLVIEGRFAPTDFGQQIRKLYDLKMVNTVSVGFIPKEFNGNVITKSELLEVSIVPVPANPQAVSLRQMQEAGIEMEMLKSKGFILEVKEAETEQNKIVPVAKTWIIHSKEKQFEFELENGESIKIVIDEHGWKNFIEMDTALLSQKAGRVLSEKNRTLIKSTIDSLQASVAALSELHDATDQGSAGKEADNNAPKTEKSNTEGLAEFDAWLKDQDLQRVLRAANTATSEVLATFNKLNRSK